MLRLGLKLWSINTDYYYDEAIRLYKSGVYDYIELYVVPGSLQHLARWQLLDIPYIIHSPHFMHGFNLAKAECELSNLEYYQEVREFADSLSAEYIIFHGGIDGSVAETARQLATFAESRALIENKPYRAIPNRMHGEFCRGYNASELEVVVANSGAGVCLDFGHAICAAASQQVDCYDYIAEFLQLNPKMFHLTDVKSLDDEYDKHLHLGTGALDVERILAMIPSDAVITLETDKADSRLLNDFVGDVEYVRGKIVY